MTPRLLGLVCLLSGGLVACDMQFENRTHLRPVGNYTHQPGMFGLQQSQPAAPSLVQEPWPPLCHAGAFVDMLGTRHGIFQCVTP